MSDGLNFLISTIINLYVMVVILRIWMQLVRADYFNPLSQFVIKVTDPVLRPLRSVIPNAGKLDLAATVLAYAIVVGSLYLRVYLAGASMPFIDVAFYAVISLISTVLSLMFWILVIRALMSWFSQGQNPMEFLFAQLTEPMLAPIRRIIPPIGGLDLSVLVLILLIQFVRHSITG